MIHLTLTHRYDVTPKRLWDLSTDLGSFEAMTRKLYRIQGLPEGRIHAGQDLRVKISIFGIGPWIDYRMHVLECDETAHRVVSEESGAGVKSWNHTFTVEPDGEGARLTDKLAIDAGWLSPVIGLWARYVYRSRHEPRLKLLGLA